MTDKALGILESMAGFAASQADSGSASKPIKLATIDPAYDPDDYLLGIMPRVTFDGESTLSTKFYPVMAPYHPFPGDRVVLIPVGITYLIIGSLDADSSQHIGGNLAVEGDVGFGSSVGVQMQYEPALTAVTDPSLGSTGAIHGFASRIGQLVNFGVAYLFNGTGVSPGSGRYDIALPWPINQGNVRVSASSGEGHVLGPAILQDDSASIVRMGVLVARTTNSAYVYVDNNGSYGFIQHSFPWIWATGDVFSVQGCYVTNQLGI